MSGALQYEYNVVPRVTWSQLSQWFLKFALIYECFGFQACFQNELCLQTKVLLRFENRAGRSSKWMDEKNRRVQDEQLEEKHYPELEWARRGLWVAHSVQHQTSALVMISRFMGSSPTSSLEPALDSASLSLCPPLLELHLCLSKMNKC